MEIVYKTKKKNTVPQRGCYSEPIGEPRPETQKGKEPSSAQKRVSLKWRSETERHAPVIPNILVSVETGRYLAPAERWITLDDEGHIAFPVEAFKPKVQLKYIVEPGELPRAVQIERKRREYALQNIKRLLTERKIPKVELIHPDLLESEIKTKDRFALNSKHHFLPLYLFDNEDFDCRTPEEWVNLGCIEGVRHPVPGDAFIPRSHDFLDSLEEDIPIVECFEWHEVAVVDFDKATKLYSLLTLDGSETMYQVPRIYLMFKAEDPQVFVARLEDAIKRRKDTENYIRYQLYLDCTMFPGIGSLPDECVNKIIDSVVTKEQKQVIEVEKLELQMQILHRRTLCDLRFRATIQQYPQMFSHVKPPEFSEMKVPEQGCLKSPMEDFQGTREFVGWLNLFMIPESYQSMCFVVEDCMRVATMNFFVTSYGKYVSLEEFETIQSQWTQNLLNFLRGQWLNGLTHNIRRYLRHVGKGWYNLTQKNWEIFEISKISRFLELVKFRMQSSVRCLVDSSLKTLVNLLETPCQCLLDVQEDFEWGNDFIHTHFKPSCNPVFYLIIDMQDGEVVFSSKPENFAKVIVQLFNTAVYESHFVPQVKPYLMVNLKFAGDLRLSSLGLLEPHVCALRDRLQFAYEKAIIPLIAYSKEYYVFMDFWKLDIVEYVKEFDAENHTVDEIKSEIQYQKALKEALNSSLPAEIVIGPFLINTNNLKQFLMNKRQDLFTKLLEMFAIRQRNEIDGILEEFATIFRKLNEKPSTIEQLFDIREWMETIPFTVKCLEDTARRLSVDYDVCEYFWYNLSKEDFKAKWEALGWPLRICIQMELTEQFFTEEVERFQKIQIDDEASLSGRIEAMTAQVTQFSRETDINRCQEVSVEIRRLAKAMKEAQEYGRVLNQRQKLFGNPVVPFETLNSLMKEFEPYRNFWLTASDWGKMYEIWMENPLLNIDGEAIASTVSEMIKSLVKAVKMFQDLPDIRDMALKLKEEIEEFCPYIPLIRALRNPGMKQRHWDEFFERTGVKVVFTPMLNFSNCLSLGIQNYVDIVTEISEAANKEYAIEGALLKMQKEWDSVTMEIVPYKTSGTYIAKIQEEVQLMLDDHITTTQQLSFSPFKATFETEINSWETKLRLVQDVLDEWMECQKQWMYLEPIFTSEDIPRQLPTENKKYCTMERTWRKIMKVAFDVPKIMSFCPDEKLLENLKDCNALLEQVQNGLSEYLETKRSVFPRFFFLSDDELLEILSQVKNPLSVQPHLRKCFENIAMLNFEEDLRIVGMYSAEGEYVAFTRFMYPVGLVENWLLDVEETMRITLQVTLGNSLAEIDSKDRTVWVLEWPGQLVIAGSQTRWTAGVELGLAQSHLAQYFKIMLAQLDGLRGLVRGPLQRVERQVLSALIVIEVHARDVTQKILDENICNVNDFEWISQLRYYWINDEMILKVVNAEFPYGYEYLGNSGRLVITPLTDRCYLTLTGALHLKFGGAPAGPAGTGKTETTKDLGKAFAVQCVVFNCSDQLDFMAMGKFFKGLASAGAWACFDEFNRIDIEVLSVIAQQITTIQKAQMLHLNRFLFEGVDIALKQSCAIFITMNPGYAGRTELPDNLKALFRPVAMMVPNYTLIAEISLFSFGFSDAKELAGKITTTFKLSSEQLSSQDHYDFGMRAVKTVIAAAGNLKREQPDMEERQIILRSLRDVNVPKFLADDLKLFNGIVSDLFPRMEEQVVDYGILSDSICSSCIKMKLQDVTGFVKKVIQLYETTVVRHGLMLVGPTGSGKTRCYNVLQEAMTSLRGKPSPSGMPFERVHTFVVNPKSITMGQLYGEFDMNTHEWTDGILSSLVRKGAGATDSDKRWYVFDGPVDAVWIENMNTVLDDNKKLCLSSGEIIKLTESQTMMFEVADLAVASPATVSRCGMVYLEPSVLGLQPFIQCWMMRQPEMIKEREEELLQLFDYYLIPCIAFHRSNLKEIVPTMDSSLVVSFLRLMDILIRPLTNPDGKPLPAEPFLKLLPDLIIPWVHFSLIWSLGATCDGESRYLFSEWLRKVADKKKDTPKFPPQGLVYDYRLHDGGFTTPTEDGEPASPKWINWMDGLPPYVISAETKFADIEVPMLDNVRNAELLGMLATCMNQVLCIGPTGTGKTITISSKLSSGMPKKFICDFITFSARTTANQTQDLLDSKLDKRRKGIYGPPILKLQLFFIDDLNMPALEVYGAQPPIELLRQWMDFKGWYDRKDIGDFRNIVDVAFIGAMGPPGGGRNPVTGRLLRHFHFLSFTELEDNSKREIFGTILASWLRRTTGMEHLHELLVSRTLDTFATILRELLPTPAKTHYTFNLRDLSKVFQGLLMMDPGNVKEEGDVLRLWYHENCRVFQDRLVNDIDRDWFDNLLRTNISEYFERNPDEILGDGIILYGDFMIVGSDVRRYEQITNMKQLSKVLDEYLEEYNSMTTKQMKLVLFLDAIRHVCRISRIIRQPLGNALLLGMGGSGRQSLTRLSAHMAEFTCFQIELSKSYSINDWRDDIKGLMMKAGIKNRETVFLMPDTQIKTEAFLEDINNILNSGDVPNIYQGDELEKIYIALKGLVIEMGMQPTISNLFTTYKKIVRSNLHTVITMSPVGDMFRARLRQFPALVNCCTIDWFSSWPETALQSVALQFLEDIQDFNVEDNVLMGIVAICQYMHQSVVDASSLFLEELSRHVYITPTSYLQLLISYSTLVTKKRIELTTYCNRLNNGLDTLLRTSEEVKQLQKDLTAMKPALKAAAEQAAIMLTKIEGDRLVAEQTKLVVEKEELAAAEKAAATQAIADDAQRDLDEAMPMLLAAEESLKALNKNDITELRTMKRPPVGVKLVMEAVCIVKDVKPLKVPGSMPGEKILDYWEPSRGMMSNPDQFLVSLVNFDKEAITETIQIRLKPYIEDPIFKPEKIRAVSKACTSLCMWLHAIYKYYFVNKAVAPKKEALAKANEELAITEGILAEARQRMKDVMDGLAMLEAQLKETEDHKHNLEENMRLCEERMDRAVRLVSGLADERERWIQTVAQLRHFITNVVGDILISSGAIAYLTPFTDKYRRGLMAEWLTLLQEKKVPHTPNCSPVETMGVPVMIRKWQVFGLPRDYLSTENAVLVMNSKRWPLFIDPQGQANRWVRNMGKESGLAICKISDRDLLRSLETAIRFGKYCMIEGIGTELDPALDSILLRQTFIQGGTEMLKVGDNVVPYSKDFRLFLTTRLPNPHYSPEVCIKVMIVNFALVPSGLQEQLLALVVMQERSDLEEARSALIVSSAQMNLELKNIEDRILYRLSASEGSPVDDIDLITTLEASKIKSEEIKMKVKDAEITQKDIDGARALYIPVAVRSQILFFCLVDLSNIDPMYQYSMEWFVSIFINSMAQTEKTEDIDERVKIINDYFTFSLYSNVCRSLFEKHKLHFAFLLCIRIQMDEGKIDATEWRHFLAGGNAGIEKPNPAPNWLSVKSWSDIQALELLPAFQGIVNDFIKQHKQYKVIFDSYEPQREPLPKPWNTKLDEFQFFLVLNALRPDKVTNAMQDYLKKYLGAQFIEPQTTDLLNIYNESSCAIPLIFVLSTGTDPASDLYKFADKMKYGNRLFVISLGQGQGPRAEVLMNESLEMGNWIFFQNCHLAPSWMPRLEWLVENIDPSTANADFRLWLTSTPSPFFPVSILQNSSKMTVEPPRGVKANMLRAYANQVAELSDFFHSDNPKIPSFKWLLFSLCLFHGVCLERRKFGPLGFNIPYEFTDGDLRICISQLQMFLLEYEDIPYKVLIYTAGHINYGGRVTDDWDRRCIMNLLDNYYNQEVMNETHAFDDDKIYHQVPSETTLVEYLEYIRSLPINDDPSLFGLHSNADISYAQSETSKCLATLLALQPKVVGGAAQSQEEVTSQAAQNILKQVPLPFNVQEISDKYPVLYEESLNTVLVQEAIRFNNLLGVIHSSLTSMLRALKGLVVMSAELESMNLSLFTNSVPAMWAAKAYPSLKPLGSWVKDLKDRIAFLNKWYNEGIPPAFWISGFYFPQAFLTGSLQNFARKYIISIDSINFGFEILKSMPTEKPTDGCCIYGLFFEGACWSSKEYKIVESRPKELYTDMAVIWLLPEVNHVTPTVGFYVCPVYKTLTRAGTLSTTGHSTNYVVAIEIPSVEKQSHWIKRGVALICALNY